jgi:branched-chain amino acid transport system substrate-binding protein
MIARTASRSTRAMKRGLAPAIVALVIAGSACHREGTPAAERVTRAARGTGALVIGAPWPWEARKDLAYGKGLDLAVDEVNASGGVRGRQIRLQREDDHESVDEGRRVAQRLAANPDVVAVIGHLQSYISVPASAVYELGDLVMICPTSTDPLLTSQGYHRVFRAIFTDQQVGHAVAELAASRRLTRTAIYYIRNNYGRGLANAFEERASQLGVEIIDRQSYDPNGHGTDASIESVADEWTQHDLKAVFIAAEPNQGARFIRALRQRGVGAQVLGGDALGTPELLRLGGAAIEGAIAVAPFHADEQRPEVQHFRATFRQRFGSEPDASAALAYDAVWVLARAMRVAKSPAGEELANALRTANEWTGVTGPFAFDSTGNLRGQHLVTVVVHAGRFEHLADASAPRATPAERALAGREPQ